MVKRITHPPGRKLNFGSGWDVLPASEGWVNLDGFVDHPNVVKHDFTRFPFPFRDNEFDYVFASHVMEHVPFIYEDFNGTRRDVLYGIMEEFHRILKPGGRLRILSPLGRTEEAFTHVQHYRHWFPKSFEYFKRLPGQEMGKYHTANLHVERVRVNRRTVRHPGLLRIGRHKLGIEEHLMTRFPRLFGWLLLGRNEIDATLVAVKP